MKTDRRRKTHREKGFLGIARGGKKYIKRKEVSDFNEFAIPHPLPNRHCKNNSPVEDNGKKRK